MQIPRIIYVFVLFTISVGCLAATPPAYYPFGPQLDVPETDLVGWKRCWNGTYEEMYTDHTNVSNIVAECTGAFLMYGCRPTDSTNLTLLAAGERTAVFNSTGPDFYSVTTSNGADWYFYPSWSMGFTKQGDPVDKYLCDGLEGNYSQYKLCWNAWGTNEQGRLLSGFRCGSVYTWYANWTREIWIQDLCYNKNDGDACDDNDPCTSNDTCQQNVCSGSPCDQCLECDSNIGCVPVKNGLSCSDADLCTNNDTCQQGVCIGESVTCSVPQGCFNSTCSALTGQCQDNCPPPLPPVSPPVTPIAPPVNDVTPVTPITQPFSPTVSTPSDVPLNSGTPIDVPESTPIIEPVTTPSKTPVKPPRAQISDSQKLIIGNGMLLIVIALLHY